MGLNKKVILAGNPNVGKSTVFNTLTGMKQHTGNWAGKTVEVAAGEYSYNGTKYDIIDLPGMYSIMSHSEEETLARDYLCFNTVDCVVVICDATCLERNLNLVLQIMEITSEIIICVNLMDEAEKKNICIDIKELEEHLGVPVVPLVARNKKNYKELLNKIEEVSKEKKYNPIKIKYTETIEKAVSELDVSLQNKNLKNLKTRWLALRLIENNTVLSDKVNKYLTYTITEETEVNRSLKKAHEILKEHGIGERQYADNVVSCLVLTAEAICSDCIFFGRQCYNKLDRKIDNILTSRITGIPIMVLFFMLIFWITIVGANYPSTFLSNLFNIGGEKLYDFLTQIESPDWFRGILIDGIYNILTWVVAVMLPPMGIFKINQCFTLTIFKNII